jgi:hypothetical protein
MRGRVHLGDLGIDERMVIVSDSEDGNNNKTVRKEI